MQEDKSQQIVHEAEMTRQQARYKIPAKIDIEGQIYEVEDWSVSGCSVKLPDEYLEKGFATGNLIFKFHDFETIIDNIKLDFLHQEEGTIGVRFSELTPQQISILNQMISAYLAGDIITQGDIIQAATRAQTYPKKDVKELMDKKEPIFILMLIYSVIAILVLFLLYVAYEKVYVVKSVNGYIDANMTILRSPAPAYITYQKKLRKNMEVNQSDTLALAYLIGGGVKRIIPTVEGKIFKVSARNGEFRNVAEPICSILPKGYSIYLVANILHKDLQKIKIGDIAKVITPENLTFYAKVSKILTSEDVVMQHSKILENIYASARDHDKVILIPNIPLTEDMISSSVTISIDTFLNEKGLIDDKNSSFFNLLF